MSRPTANLRLFVGIYPPHEVARGLLKAAAILELPAHRACEIHQVHMTLQFIGDTPAAVVDDTLESVARSASGLKPFVLTPLKLITLPERGAARLVAAETDAPAVMMEMHRRLVTRLAHDVRLKPDSRFLPHLTLCRFKQPTRINPIDHRLEIPAFEVASIVLMRSTLTPNGAQHHEMAVFALGG